MIECLNFVSERNNGLFSAKRALLALVLSHIGGVLIVSGKITA